MEIHAYPSKEMVSESIITIITIVILTIITIKLIIM